jgi:hypothetical protein
MKRLAPLLVAVLALAACGGGSGRNSDHRGRLAQAQIKSAYEKFFSSDTPLSERVALLQNGEQFKPLVKSFASNPLASKTSATVSSVKLQGSDKAKVVYVVKFSGSSLPKQTGTAVREGGKWKVGYGSLCKLIALGGTTPSACKS